MLFVDYANTDTVSWWDCRALASHFLFPPLVFPVKLHGIKLPGMGTNFLSSYHKKSVSTPWSKTPFSLPAIKNIFIQLWLLADKWSYYKKHERSCAEFM